MIAQKFVRSLGQISKTARHGAKLVILLERFARKMAQLHEYQAKEILEQTKIAIPSGKVARTPEEVFEIAAQIGGSVVVKAQIHSTSRAAQGAIRFAANAAEAEEAAREIFSKTKAEAILVEEKLLIKREFYIGFIINTELKRPTLLFSDAGGSGIEERAETMKTLVCSIRSEPTIKEIQTICGGDGDGEQIAAVLQKLYRAAKSCEARTAEINPLALTEDDKFVALDARISVDDYAVFRHPELGIEIARELGHTPTKLEKIAWEIERDDFRGTFYFVEILDEQSETKNPKSKIRIGFHGAGGGGSMASLDAAQRNGLQPACYVDTSGNPPASKVYRAARIILSIPHIQGYFLSGSGVASQEQFVLARGILKAFLETQPPFPAVLRLGGNGEEIAKRLVEKYAEYLPAPVEAYQKIHSADFCAARLRKLTENFQTQPQRGTKNAEQKNLQTQDTNFQYSFKTRTGEVFFDHDALAQCDVTAIIESCPTGILSKNKRGLPVLNIPEEEAQRGKCVECLACEFAAWNILGVGRGAKIKFPISGLTTN
jgi:succinyl-CoA synthetase beta subunit